MKNMSHFRNILTVATLLATTLTGMESIQAAPLALDMATVAPGQTNVVSTNVAVNKKRRNKKKRAGAMKKPGDAMQKPEAMKKPEGDAMGDTMKKPGDGMKK
jgi:hypothetical protein